MKPKEKIHISNQSDKIIEYRIRGNPPPLISFYFNGAQINTSMPSYVITRTKDKVVLVSSRCVALYASFNVYVLHSGALVYPFGALGLWGRNICTGDDKNTFLYLCMMTSAINNRMSIFLYVLLITFRSIYIYYI